MVPDMNGSGQPPKLLDQMRAVLRTQRYAIRTEEAYCDWVRRYIKFHQMRSREDLGSGTHKEKASSSLLTLSPDRFQLLPALVELCDFVFRGGQFGFEFVGLSAVSAMKARGGKERFDAGDVFFAGEDF
jgi:Phage integrase, N-terminal SAM-like domain